MHHSKDFSRLSPAKIKQQQSTTELKVVASKTKISKFLLILFKPYGFKCSGLESVKSRKFFLILRNFKAGVGPRCENFFPKT